MMCSLVIMYLASKYPRGNILVPKVPQSNGDLAEVPNFEGGIFFWGVEKD